MQSSGMLCRFQGHTMHSVQPPFRKFPCILSPSWPGSSTPLCRWLYYTCIRLQYLPVQVTLPRLAGRLFFLRFWRSVPAMSASRELLDTGATECKAVSCIHRLLLCIQVKTGAGGESWKWRNGVPLCSCCKTGCEGHITRPGSRIQPTGLVIDKWHRAVLFFLVILACPFMKWTV